jgi:hypothetical protein
MHMTTPLEIVQALDLVADYYAPDHGRWACRAFDAINATFFDGKLPRPLIVWALTAYGGCLGLTHMLERPTIVLHPSLMKPSETGDGHPWGMSEKHIGVLLAFDVLLHESIHVAQRSIHHDLREDRQSSHNRESWIVEVNRIAPLLGMNGIQAGLNKPKRVAIPGEFTPRGKPKTKVTRVDEGNVPLKYYSRFPDGVREFLGTADDYYQAGILPCGITL